MKKIALTLLILSFLPLSGYEEEVACYPGECYYNCQRAFQLTAGILIGSAVIAGMIIVLVKDGNTGHSGH